jgi:rsbT antagonist protein RsbS
MDVRAIQRIPLQLSQNCIVASIQVDLNDDLLRLFREDLLSLLQSSEADGIILDFSGVEIIDGEDWDAIRGTMTMANLMGARSIVAGLRPGVVSSLVELEVDVEDIDAALNLDEALKLMAAFRVMSEENEEAESRDGEAAQGDGR